MIYTGPLGQHSSLVIQYFQVSFFQLKKHMSFLVSSCSRNTSPFSFIIFKMFVGGKKQSIHGVAKIRDNYNPATWMLEVTSQSAEIELDMDFAKIYNASDLYK